MDRNVTLIRILSLVVVLQAVALAYAYFPVTKKQISQVKTPPTTNYEQPAEAEGNQVGESQTNFEAFLETMTEEERNAYLSY